MVGPIKKLVGEHWRTLERENRIYWTMYLCILAILVAGVVVGFGGYMGGS